MPKKYPPLKPKELLKVLERAGFEIDRIKGSHHVLYHRETKKMVVVPFHKKELPKGTMHAILRSAEISSEELDRLLKK